MLVPTDLMDDNTLIYDEVFLDSIRATASPLSLRKKETPMLFCSFVTVSKFKSSIPSSDIDNYLGCDFSQTFS